MFATRDEIVKYCKKNNISYREDSSNADTKYLRNKIRHEILPLIRKLNPSVESTLNSTAERLAGISEIVNLYIDQLRNEMAVQKSEFISFKISLLKPLVRNKTILFELFRPYGIVDVSLTDLIHLIEGRTGSRLHTATHMIIKNRQDLVISAESAREVKKRIINSMRDFELVPEIESVKSVHLSDNFKIPEDNLFACLDAERLTFPLTVRRWNTGDFFYPLGMKGRKKISDYFIDKKYSIFEKDNALILECNGNIVCILGDRIDNRFRITATSKNALIIKAVMKRTVAR